jgi:hypothetical protein
MPDEENLLLQVQTEMDNYQATVQALYALVLTILQSEGQPLADGHYSLGRRMRTTAANRIRPSATVTPDAVVQQSSGLGYVGEAKASLPTNQDHWKENVEQLHKYDDDLVGWWTEDGSVPVTDVVCLLGPGLAAKFAQFASDLEVQRGWLFGRKRCFVEFMVITRARQFLYLKREAGTLTDQMVLQALREGVMHSIEDLIASPQAPSFCDSEPPPEYIMQKLWQNVFTRMKSEMSDDQYDENLRCWPLDVQVADLASELQRLYGSRGETSGEVTFPRTRWVRGALEALVAAGLAEHVEGEHYRVRFRLLGGDLIRIFARHRSKSRARDQPKAVQLGLPGTE